MTKEKLNFKKIVYVMMIIMILFISNCITYNIVKANTVSIVTEKFIQKEIKEKENLAKKAKNNEVERQNLINKEASFEVNLDKVKGIDNIMLVAHPDDESLWAGNHILNGKYFIVCLTNGTSKARTQEFYKVLKKTGNEGIILRYPDLTNKKKNDWKKDKFQIEKDIRYLLNLRDWKKIITHNPEGEYGHIHHKMLSYLVTNECIAENKEKKLYYFERFYKKNKLINNDIKASMKQEDIQRKTELILGIYYRRGASKLYEYMFPYEKFISYEDWTFEEQ